MEYELRESIANEFAETIRIVREEKWKIFCEAAASDNLDPYVALARMLVRELERQLGGAA